MSGTLIKICGVRSPEIAQVVESLDADLMGLIFAPSKRQVTPDEAERIVGAVDRRTKVVGVFVNESVGVMNELAARLNLDFVQLSGDEPAEVQAEIIRPVIRALRIPVETATDDACRHAERFFSCVAPAHALLLDTHVPGVYGGSGREGDWNLAARLAERFPLILAGGLRQDNVGQALDVVQPLGVDVSSGVETEGHKDPIKIEQFIANVRRSRESESAATSASTRLVRALG